MRKIKGTFTSPLLVLVIYVLLLASRYIDISALKYKGSIYLSLIILQMLIFILPGVFYSEIRIHNTKKKLKLNGISLRGYWFVFTAFGLLIFGSVLINFGVYSIFDIQQTYTLYNTYTPQNGGTLTNMVYVFIAFAVVPAITEEYIFRGIVLSDYAEFGVTTAIILSSLMFAMLHFNIAQLPTYFFCGVITAYTVYVTQSLYAGIILHLLNNIYSLFFQSYLQAIMKSPTSIVFFIFFLVFMFLVFLLLSFSSAETIMNVNGLKGVKSPPESKVRPGGIKNLFFALVSPTFLACIIAFIVAITALK